MEQADLNYIELHRTFFLVPESDDDSPSDFSHYFSNNGSVSWDDLLKEYRVVILSEAGSGKTEEIRHISRRLRFEEKYAFFIRLEHVERSFELAFEEGTYDEFQQWKLSDEEAWLFLDSVDESRLSDPRDFETAILSLGHRLASSKQRIHIVLTSRASAWRSQTDYKLCNKQLSLIDQSTGNNKDISFKVYSLSNLNSEQVRAFAISKGIENVQLFISSIDKVDAWAYTTRPQDLEELVQFWEDNKRIGNRLELMENSVNRRLMERDPTRDNLCPLSMERARNAVKLIAASSTLMQEQVILIPGSIGGMKGLPINTVLPDWIASDCTTLLSRPIFDEAIYGTVRFHHRSVREYLTAEWFSDLLQKQSSRNSIEELFFKEKYGIQVVVPSMRAVLPWLAIFDQNICDRLCRVAPEVLLEGGDPSQLPLVTRQSILRQVCDQLANKISNRSIQDYSAIQRFASKDLAEEIKRLINKYEDNEDLLWFLLRMVSLGELSEALPQTISIAHRAATGISARKTAFQVVLELGDEADKTKLRNLFLKESEILNRDLLARLVNLTDSNLETIVWLYDCLNKVEDKRPHSSDLLSESLITFIGKTNVEHLAYFLSLANTFLEKPPFIDQGYCEISLKYKCLIKPSAIAVQRLCVNGHAFLLDPTGLAILHKIPMLGHYRNEDSPITELGKLVPAWKSLNLELFWYAVEYWRKYRDETKNEKLADYWLITVYGKGYVEFSANDFDEIIKEIAVRDLLDDKLIALSLAFQLYVDSGRKVIQRKQLKKVTASNSVLSDRLAIFLRPPKQSEQQRKFNAQRASWERADKARLLEEEKNRDTWRKYLASNLNVLKGQVLENPSDISQAQWYLYERMSEIEENSSSWSVGNWHVLKDEFGMDVASAFHDGIVTYWRKYKPQLRSEGASPLQTDFHIIFGLTGLSIEAKENHNWCTTLTPSETEIAFRYAMHELNGFPFWFEYFFYANIKTVSQYILTELYFELAQVRPDSDSYISYIIDDLVWSGSWAWSSVAPDIYESINHFEPGSLRALGQILIILQGSTLDNKKLEQLALTKISHLENLDNAAYWFAVFVGVNSELAIPMLEQKLLSIVESEDSTRFAMTFISRLLGGRLNRGTNTRESFRTPEYLKALYLLMHRYIKQDEDINRIGKGVYSPGLRDDAQDARNHLFSLLKEIPGKPTYLALNEISNSHPDELSRSWFKLHAKERAEADASSNPWSLIQVRDFYERQERTPNSHRELFDLVIMRLKDLKADLERGDSSEASILKTIKEEVEVRKYIGNRCRQTSQGRYSIPQEEELADAKKPDFRFHGVGFDGPVPIELKLADNWTGPQLIERLENQLCGDYLRDERSRLGVFLLIYRGEKTSWQVGEPKETLNFDQFVQYMSEHWGEISKNYPKIDDVLVIGIDLTARFR